MDKNAAFGATPSGGGFDEFAGGRKDTGRRVLVPSPASLMTIHYFASFSAIWMCSMLSAQSGQQHLHPSHGIILVVIFGMEASPCQRVFFSSLTRTAAPQFVTSPPCHLALRLTLRSLIVSTMWTVSHIALGYLGNLLRTGPLQKPIHTLGWSGIPVRAVSLCPEKCEKYAAFIAACRQRRFTHLRRYKVFMGNNPTHAWFSCLAPPLISYL
ncbi:hypothetical protein BDN70DRAFT_518046 [Pholiota conissans]|uniref:Uncharacterized protein n=1 Tax=Pholiota conissans TaxID=109636 RepID=A0A9P5Z6P7_9AGAR|nr:hypothetical protein BDN70DRAFT_518046 [Pholiota conissans]